MKKIKAVDLLIKKGLVFDAQEGIKKIMAGEFYSINEKIEKPGQLLKLDTLIFSKENKPFVSRAGYKLAYTIEVFNLDFKNKVVLDIGSSTGGFSDCALQNGAKFIYSLDVGTNQLAYSLRINPNIKVMENINLKDIKPEMFDKKIDIVVCDVSFISLKHVFNIIGKLCNTLMLLIKPQFEASREQMENTNGVLNDLKIHKEIINNLTAYAFKHNFCLIKVLPSPIKGKIKKNIEYVSLWSHC